MHNQAMPTPTFRASLICRGLFVLLPLTGWHASASPLTGDLAMQVQSPSGTTPKEPFEADERLEIPVILNPLRVAEPNEIPIVLHGPGLKMILSMQAIDGSDPYGMKGGEQTPELLHHPDGSTYVNIVPIRLGKLKISLMATFT